MVAAKHPKGRTSVRCHIEFDKSWVLERIQREVIGACCIVFLNISLKAVSFQ